MVLVAPPQFYGTGAYGACHIIHYPHTPGCTGGHNCEDPSDLASQPPYTASDWNYFNAVFVTIWIVTTKRPKLGLTIMTPGKARGKKHKVGQEPRRWRYKKSRAAFGALGYLPILYPRLHQGLQLYQSRNPAGRAPSGLTFRCKCEKSPLPPCQEPVPMTIGRESHQCEFKNWLRQGKFQFDKSWIAYMIHVSIVTNPPTPL